jgi:hypothetical protein
MDDRNDNDDIFLEPGKVVRVSVLDSVLDSVLAGEWVVGMQVQGGSSHRATFRFGSFGVVLMIPIPEHFRSIIFVYNQHL